MSPKKAAPVAKTSSDYTVKVVAPDVRVGEPGKVRVEIKPASAFKINTEYPWKISVPSSDQIKVSNTEIGKSNVELSKKSAAFTIDCTVDSAGDHKLGVVANFSVCNDDVCKNFRDEPIQIAFQAVP